MATTEAIPVMGPIRRRWPCALGAFLAIGLFAGAGAQQIYGWTDANGDVTYSNLPPPKGAKVTDVIPDTPLSPQAVQEAARRSELSALKDRIRLLELEQARNKREVVDYPGTPATAEAPAPCTSDSTAGCDPTAAPYYTTSLLYGTGRRRGDHDGDRHADHHGDGHGPRHPPHGPLNITPPPPAHAVPIAASPNRSSLQEH